MKSSNIVLAVFSAIFRVVVAILAVMLIYRGALACYNYGYRIFTEPAAGRNRLPAFACTPVPAL